MILIDRLTQIDLKHFKSKRLALRWRTATEVVEGLGEETCGCLRCPSHPSGNEGVELKSFELPFIYVEDGARKEALVKVRLCTKCAKKLRWKPEDERRERRRSSSPRHEGRREREDRRDGRRERDRERGERDRERDRDRDRDRVRDRERRRTRSRS